MADWIGYLAFLLASLAEAIGRHCRAGPAVHADDTPIHVLAPGLGKTKRWPASGLRGARPARPDHEVQCRVRGAVSRQLPADGNGGVCIVWLVLYPAMFIG